MLAFAATFIWNDLCTIGVCGVDVCTVLSVSLVRIFYGGLSHPFTIPATGKSTTARYHHDETAVDFIGQWSQDALPN
jgi:hypothetical protein